MTKNSYKEKFPYVKMHIYMRDVFKMCKKIYMWNTFYIKVFLKKKKNLLNSSFCVWKS